MHFLCWCLSVLSASLRNRNRHAFGVLFLVVQRCCSNDEHVVMAAATCLKAKDSRTRQKLSWQEDTSIAILIVIFSLHVRPWFGSLYECQRLIFAPFCSPLPPQLDAARQILSEHARWADRHSATQCGFRRDISVWPQLRRGPGQASPLGYGYMATAPPWDIIVHDSARQTLSLPGNKTRQGCS